MQSKTDIHELAASIGVSMAEACERCGISPSTPSRWVNGTKPRSHTLRRLHAAIIDIAKARGTLPKGMAQARKKSPALTAQIVRRELKAIHACMARIEEAIGE